MLFNSYAFILLFLPLTAFAYFLIARRSHFWACTALCGASLAFYGYWDYRFVPILLSSILINYTVARLIADFKQRKPQLVHATLVTGIAINLAALGYFKYANFFLSVAEQALGDAFIPMEIALPLGISFFTFTQIAFLVDVAAGKASETNFQRYFLFVTYFPHLIAGPVIHHAQMMPQFSNEKSYAINWRNMAIGLSIFVLGLGKKVLLADAFANYATPVFGSAASGHAIVPVEAWIGVISYSLQLYFDFSGYSDMAIGISLLFNIRLPINFNSPYKATNIIDFWRRWHITLSTFLRDYLYIPLGGNRLGPARRYVNLMLTMALGGLWHGAGWTFLIWGSLHGLYLIVNHGWRNVKPRLGAIPFLESPWLNRGITFIFVVFAWVFFRADSVPTALSIFKSLFFLDGLSVPSSLIAFLPTSFHSLISIKDPVSGLQVTQSIGILFLGLCIVWGLPNTLEMTAQFSPTSEQIPMDGSPTFLERMLSWRLTMGHCLFIALWFTVCLCSLNQASEFLYFQF